MEQNNDPMGAFDLSEDEIRNTIERETIRARVRDGRICICGHPLTRHSTYADVVACNPTKMICDCKDIRVVVETSDTRWFLRKTEGSGASHALVKAMQTARDKGADVKWLVDPVCDKPNCGNRDIRPVIVMQEKNGKSIRNTILLCSECRSSL